MVITPTRSLPWHGRSTPRSVFAVATIQEPVGAGVLGVPRGIVQPAEPEAGAGKPLVDAVPARTEERVRAGGRAAQLLRFLRSARISRAAFWPGWPVTPPPGWAPEPAR